MAEVQSLKHIFTPGMIQRLGNSAYVYTYPEPIQCSKATLEDLECFMTFSEKNPERLPECLIDFAPTWSDNMDILQLQPSTEDVKAAIGSSTPLQGRYSWEAHPYIGYAWSEDVWNARLGSCLQQLENVEVVEAFRWNAPTYKRKVKTIFPNVPDVQFTPFCGYMDFLIRLKNLHLAKFWSYTIVNPLRRSKSPQLFCVLKGESKNRHITILRSKI